MTGGRVLCALVVLAALPAAAAHSGLTIVPTTDTLGENMWCLHLQLDGRFSGVHADTYFLNTEMTLGERLEFGLDIDVSGEVEDGKRAYFNVKYVFAVSKSGRFKAAAGFWNGDPVKGIYPYVTGTADLGFLRVHGGVTQTDVARGRREDWFVGADRTFAGRWTLMADYQSGDENFATASVSCQITSRWGGLVGLQWPNGGGGALYTFQIWLVGHHGGRGGSRG